jgi:hypothetical protein
VRTVVDLKKVEEPVELAWSEERQQARPSTLRGEVVTLASAAFKNNSIARAR